LPRSRSRGSAGRTVSWRTTRGRRLRPGVAGWHEREGRDWVGIDLDGLRGPHVPVAKPPGTWRVAVLGDSVVQAIHVPYDQTFTAVLERELRGTCPARRGRPVEVWNFGVSGYGTAQQLLTLREQVLRHEPDLLAGFLATILSNPFQVHPDAGPPRAIPRRCRRHRPPLPEGRIQALGARGGFEVLALAPGMQREAGRRRLFFHGFPNTKPGVGHWKAAGHDFAGERSQARSAALGGRAVGRSAQHIDVTGYFGYDRAMPWRPIA
jgi:hypothetical protein